MYTIYKAAELCPANLRSHGPLAHTPLECVVEDVGNVTLQFSTRPGLGSRLIRWFTWSEFSHVDFVLYTADGVWLLGSKADGVKRRPYIESNYSHVARFNLPDCPPAAVQFAETQIGKPYDFSALFGFLLRRDWAEDDSWFCSELVYWAFEQAGYRPFRGMHMSRITPQHLLMLPTLRLVEEWKRE